MTTKSNIRPADLIEQIKQSHFPTVCLTQNGSYCFEDGPDANMIADLMVLENSTEIDDSLHIKLNFKPYRQHNESVASHDWYDDNNKPTLTWFESGFYPENGIVEGYASGRVEDEFLEDIFTIVENPEQFRIATIEVTPALETCIIAGASLDLQTHNEAHLNYIKSLMPKLSKTAQSTLNAMFHNFVPPAQYPEPANADMHIGPSRFANSDETKSGKYDNY